VGLFYLKVYGYLKTVNIMANVKLTFLGTENSGTNEHKLECFANTNKEIYISLDLGNYPPAFICLDVSTAIKLCKVLRQEINLIKK